MNFYAHSQSLFERQFLHRQEQTADILGEDKDVFVADTEGLSDSIGHIPE